MRFRFRLARVLKVKEIWEEQAKLKLAAAVVVRTKEEQLLAQKATYLQTTWIGLTEPGCKEAHRMSEHYMLANMAKKDYARQTARVQKAQSVFIAARQQFIQRRAERQALGRLEEKRRAEFIQQAQRMDLKQLDEVASISHLKRQRRV